MFENKAKVTRVIDGDTFVCDVEVMLFGIKFTAHDIHVRMLGINTPERGEEGYQEATDYTTRKLLNQEIILRSEQTVDVFDRLLATVILRGYDINKELLDKGLAKVYVRK